MLLKKRTRESGPWQQSPYGREEKVYVDAQTGLKSIVLEVKIEKIKAKP